MRNASSKKAEDEDRPQDVLVNGPTSRGVVIPATERNTPFWEVYKLPADVTELDRLSLQHHVWIEMMRGLCPVPKSLLQEVLRDSTLSEPSILDLGSGSGIWATDMAKAFPEAQVVGFDICKSCPESVPPNCRFEQGDWKAGLHRFKDSFDVVNTRSVIGHMQTDEWPFAFKEALQCLRPGGLLILMDGDTSFLNEHKEPIIPASGDEDEDPTHSWSQRYFQEINKRAWDHVKTGPGPHYESWIKDSGEFQEGSIGYMRYLGPLNWEGEGIHNGEKIGKMMHVNWMNFIPAWKPLFQSTGVPDDTFEMWIEKIKEELAEPRVKQYTQWHAAWGRRTLC